jgi:hypothetical protein
MADERERAPGSDPAAGQARALPDAEPRRMAMSRGYGRDFGGGGYGQGFDGSWGQGYGGSVAPSDYREGFGGEAYGGGMQASDYERSFGGRGDAFGGDDRNWIDQRADERSAGAHRGRGPRGWSRSDERIREEVCERLLQDRLLDARGVEVSVQDGVVTLSGEAPGASDAAHAEMLARQAPGVTDVRVELRHAPGRHEVDRTGAADAQGQLTRWGRLVPPFAP